MLCYDSGTSLALDHSVATKPLPMFDQGSSPKHGTIAFMLPKFAPRRSGKGMSDVAGQIFSFNHLWLVSLTEPCRESMTGILVINDGPATYSRVAGSCNMITI